MSPTDIPKATIDWLLDSDPSIRWQVMRDLTDEPPDVVAAERSRVATEGWGARLLALQDANGQWGGGTFHPEWTSTFNTLALLWDMGLDPDQRVSPPGSRAWCERRSPGTTIRKSPGPTIHSLPARWSPASTDGLVAIGSYFGQDVAGCR